MKPAILSFIMIGVMIAVPATAKIYKCTDANGVMTFSDQPCAADAEVAFQGVGSAESLGNEICTFSATLPKNAGVKIQDAMRIRLYAKARSIADSLLPGEDSDGDNKTHHLNLNNQALFFYGGAKGSRPYTVRIFFKALNSKNGDLIYSVDMIIVEKNYKPYDIPMLSEVACLSKIGPSKWKVK